MIEERNVKVERVARAKYALFEHDNIEENERNSKKNPNKLPKSL